MLEISDLSALLRRRKSSIPGSVLLTEYSLVNNYDPMLTFPDQRDSGCTGIIREKSTEKKMGQGGREGERVEER